MRETSSAMTADANLTSEADFGNLTPAARALRAVMNKIHTKFKEEKAKPIAHIAARANVSTRAVEDWKGNRALMSGEALTSLILSDVGESVIDAILTSCPPKERPTWARRYLNTIRMAHLEQKQAEQDEELKQLRLSLLK